MFFGKKTGCPLCFSDKKSRHANEKGKVEDVEEEIPGKMLRKGQPFVCGLWPSRHRSSSHH